MRLSNILYMAIRNLLSRRFRVFITIGGVAIGVASIVFLVSIGFGLEALVTDQVANFRAFTSFEVTTSNQETIPITDKTVQTIHELGRVNDVEAVIMIAGRVKPQGKEANAETVIHGLTSNYLGLIDTIYDAGNSFNDDKNEVVINESLVNLLGYENKASELIGQTLSIDLVIPPDMREGSTEGISVKEGIIMTVAGVTNDTGNPILYLPSQVVKEAGVARYSLLRVMSDGRDGVPIIRQSVEALGLNTTYVGDTVDQISQVFVFFRIILAGFGLIALIVAALGTFNVLTISLLERTREVGFLKALGFVRRDVYLLFLSESLFIGLAGGTFGILLGILGGWGINRLMLVLATRANADPVTIFILPLGFAVLIYFGSVVVGFITGIYPARRAVRTSPLDALRYE